MAGGFCSPASGGRMVGVWDPERAFSPAQYFVWTPPEPSLMRMRVIALEPIAPLQRGQRRWLLDDDRVCEVRLSSEAVAHVQIAPPARRVEPVSEDVQESSKENTHNYCMMNCPPETHHRRRAGPSTRQRARDSASAVNDARDHWARSPRRPS
jgi:hypothetical protein